MDNEERIRHEADVSSGIRDALRAAALLCGPMYAIDHVKGVLAREADDLLDDCLANLRADGLVG